MRALAKETKTKQNKTNNQSSQQQICSLYECHACMYVYVCMQTSTASALVQLPQFEDLGAVKKTWWKCLHLPAVAASPTQL
jgi:hypothetical protein